MCLYSAPVTVYNCDMVTLISALVIIIIIIITVVKVVCVYLCLSFLFFPALPVTVAGTHYFYPWRDGRAELKGVVWLNAKMVNPSQY